MLLAPSFGGDTGLAENYINGSGARTAAVEIGVALGWTLIWFGLARVARLLFQHDRKRTT